MQPYTDAEIDEAIERIAADVARRIEQPEFPREALEALIVQLRRMETARRGADLATARLVAQTAQPAFEAYRPTNATSRSKAMLVEVVATLVANNESPSPSPSP